MLHHTVDPTDRAAELQRLHGLIAQVLPLLPPTPPAPSSAPVAGQSVEEWHAEAARLRVQHDAMALEVARLAADVLGPVPLPLVRSHFTDVPTPCGTLSARVYLPEGDGPHPALLFLHGGAWWMGGGPACFELNDRLCREICAEAGAIVVNLDYRLAPEHPFPAQYDDALAALEWLRADAAGLGVDPDRIGLLGVSSGGNCAASTARTAAERGMQLRLLVLLQASLDMTGSSPSLNADPAWREVSMPLREGYLQGRIEMTDPRVSPLLAEDFSVLPPTVVVVGTEDPLRDDGIRFATRVDEAGVPAELHEFVMTHVAATREVQAAVDGAIVAGVRRHLVGAAETVA